MVCEIDVVRGTNPLFYCVRVVLICPTFALLIFYLKDCGALAIAGRQRIQARTEEDGKVRWRFFTVVEEIAIVKCLDETGLEVGETVVGILQHCCEKVAGFRRQ